MAVPETSQETHTRIKNLLRAKGVKLWLPPYTNENNEPGTEAIHELAKEFSKDVSISEEIIISCLSDLRQHTVERLKQNENFKKQKLATLKIKYSSRSSTSKREFQNIELRLDITGQELKEVINKALGITEDVKMICSGRVIQLESSLQSQNVRHNSVILCIVIKQSARDESNEEQEALKAVKRARKGAELLAEMGTDSTSLPGSFDIQIEDQKGQSLDLPDEEKKSLTVALGLHEKGRTILKRKNYELALLLLLEADKEFKECRAEILKMVDNYAVLCMDIVWCYVCTKNISALPDAKVRLAECEKAFNKSYGSSLQRLLSVKGSSGNEISLFVRLYLLQAIVNYHDGNYPDASKLLDKAQGYSKMVVTDQNKVTELMTLGLSEREARRALRSNMMDVKLASQWAFKQREEHRKIKEREKEKKRVKRLQKEFGPCANGDLVNITTYEQLVNQMGFEPSLVAEALKHANNDVGGAIEMIGTNPDQLKEAAEAHAKEKKANIKKTALQQLKSMGFDEGTSKAALLHFSGAMDKAAAYLAESAGNVPPEWIDIVKAQVESDGAGTSKFSAEERAMMRDVAQDVTQREDEYLDITLEEELELINQYMTMITSVMEQ